MPACSVVAKPSGKADSANVVTETNNSNLSNTAKEAKMTKNVNTQISAQDTIESIDFSKLAIEKTRFETERGVVTFNRNEEGRVTSIFFDLGFDDQKVIRGKTWGWPIFTAMIQLHDS
jgi:hypothetical protein